MLAQSTRLKCKADTCYIPTADGVYLCGNESRLTLKGKSLYPLLAHLVPHLTGDVTLAELTGDLDGDRKRMVTNLLEKLFDHRFLVDLSQNQPHTLDPRELAAYAPNIAFIESFQASAPVRFEAFRAARLLLIGSGPACAALVQAGLQCGASKLSVLVTPEGAADERSYQEIAEALAGSASEEVRLLAALCWENEAEVRAALQECDVVLHLAAWPLLERAWLLNRLCVEQGKILQQAVLVDDQAWLGPLVRPEHEGCWECAWRRLQANQPQLAGTGPVSSRPRSLGESQATVLANRLLFPVFQHITQSGTSEPANQASVVDLTTFLSERHAFSPHPACQSCQRPVTRDAAGFLAQIQQLSQHAPLDPDGFLEDVATCVDESLGLFTALEAGHFAQAPLAVYRARLANPDDQRVSPAETRDVIAVSVYARDASIRTAQKACEHFAAACVEPRRLLSALFARQAGVPVIPASQLLVPEGRLLEDERWSWALALETNQAVLLPAGSLFSLSTRGVASGLTWEEAVCQALLDWCAYLTVEQLTGTQEPYPRLDLDGAPLTAAGAHLYRLLQASGEPFAFYDVTGSLGVPVVATCLRDRVVAYSAHCDLAQALRLGLEQALQQYQSELFQQPEYALAAVPDLPQRLRGTQVSGARYALPESWPVRREWLLQRLQSSGLSAFVVPLDHEPTLARPLPFLVRVLMASSELKKEV